VVPCWTLASAWFLCVGLHVGCSALLRLVSTCVACVSPQIVVVREPLARSVAIYYWLGRRPSALRKLVGMKDAVTDPMAPPPVAKASHYAKNLAEWYTGPGSSDLPRWPWHAFAWGPAEAVEMLEARKMVRGAHALPLSRSAIGGTRASPPYVVDEAPLFTFNPLTPPHFPDPLSLPPPAAPKSWWWCWSTSTRVCWHSGGR